MTKEEFLNEHNGAPYDLEELAVLITKISDDADLVSISKNYLKHLDAFNQALDKIGYEFG